MLLEEHGLLLDGPEPKKIRLVDVHRVPSRWNRPDRSFYRQSNS
jgi:hypothetical protein